MSDAVKQERRRAQRVDATLAMNLHLDLPQGGGDIETINVSSTGVYFRTPTYIEPMTKLAMSFDVEHDEGETKPVECEGIVARVQPDLPSETVDTYEVAVFFTTIDAESLHNLERYVERRLAP